MSLSKALTAAAGNAGGDNLYVEDVFSTYLYTGNNSTQTITNNIDLSGEGGLVWFKRRSTARTHILIDTERGNTSYLQSNETVAEETGITNTITSFNSDGFSLGDQQDINGNAETVASWTFRKAEKFFDVQTYTGNGTTQNISHNLGSTPAVIIVKNTQSSTYWAVYHGSIPAYVGFLNATNAFNTSNTQNFGNNTNPVAPTDSVFTVGQQSLVNSSGETYVAYLFASDAGGFGDDGSESIIKCGSFTADGSGNATIDLGFEPQWVLAKGTDHSGNWFLRDNMRGMPVSGTSAPLFPNTSDSEGSSSVFSLNSTGLSYSGLASGNNFIYIAIRRPMKTPESGTEVFMPALASSSGDFTAVAGFPVDMNIYSQRSSANNHFTYDRLRGGSYLATDTTSAESGDFADWDSMTDFYLGGVSGNYSDYINWMFKRATGFFDVVAYTGTATSGNPDTFSHNLKATPELMILKCRSTTKDWPVYHADLGVSKKLYLNLSNAQASAFSGAWNTAPTDTVFTVGDDSEFSGGGRRYIAYLFATLAGVSKVGSYTGNNLNTTIDCGFSNGARFVMIKRIDSTGDWTVFDTARGWSTSTDYWLDLNNTNAEASGNTLTLRSAGFGVRGSPYDAASLNVSGATYIYLAIAQEYQLWNTEYNQAAKS